MSFQVLVTGVEEMADRQMMTEVQIERRLYGHSEAHVVVRWQETEGFPDRPAALLAAKALNCPIEVVWRDNDLAENTPCFRGYVQHASAQRLPTSSVLTLSCVSYSKRTDLIPRFRAFQATTLHDIAQLIARTEPLVRIVNAADLDVPIALSLQHAETDFAYLSRMLPAWGVPMATDDRTGKVLLGARGREPAVPFPGADWGWSHITFAGALQSLPSLVQSGSGATGLARQALGNFLGQLTRRAADYHPTPEHPQLQQTHAQTASQAGTSGYRMHLDGAVLPHAPGDVVEVEGQQHLIYAVSIMGHPQQATASQQFQLQPLTLPLAPARPMPQWPSRTLWAYVTDNEKDPQQQGRVQVEFEPEPLDPQPSSQRAWLHTLAPYGGGMGPDGARLTPGVRSPRAHAYAGGFYSLPEVGERVLVEFLGQWDGEAVVIGTVRHGGVSPADSARDTKRWRTPSGNEFALTTQGEGAAARDVVSVHARDHVVLQAVVDASGEGVSVQCGPNYMHLVNAGGAVRVEVVSGGAMLLHAAGHMQIEGDSVQITAKGGAVRVSDRAGAGAALGGKTIKTPTKGKKAVKAVPRTAKGPCFDCAMDFLKPHEGGYTNDPNDHGGATNLGVTHGEYDAYRKAKGLEPRDIRDITSNEASDVFYNNYWLRYHCDQLPSRLAMAHFDWSVLHGPSATRDLRGVLGVTKKGGFNLEMKEALAKKVATPSGAEEIVSSYLDARQSVLNSIVAGDATQKKFLKGWTNRVDDLRHRLKHVDKYCPDCK